PTRPASTTRWRPPPCSGARRRCPSCWSPWRGGPGGPAGPGRGGRGGGRGPRLARGGGRARAAGGARGRGAAGGGRGPRRAAAGEVVVDFTRPDLVEGHCTLCIEAGVPLVLGTSGLTPELRDDVDEEARDRGVQVFWAPNFAIGAVLMMSFAEQAARLMPRA